MQLYSNVYCLYLTSLQDLESVAVERLEKESISERRKVFWFVFSKQ